MINIINNDESNFYKTLDLPTSNGIIKSISIRDIESEIIDSISQTRKQLIKLYNKNKWKRGNRK